MTKEWPATINVRKEVCFADAKGRYKPGIEKQQVKLVLPLTPLLTKLLLPGEEVLCLSTERGDSHLFMSNMQAMLGK